ncbi:MAG: type VI secretion system baseplate subunit TssG [Burkholderiales bacterium]|nr:type VI secretion system baseplate subunit TssG [Nitrosomonas sp.]MCP5273340.1 type VI secretion system baseplate subunit TssG [Burkholderiales bacterium]
MASQDRNQSLALELLEELQREPYRFDFYQAIRLFECVYRDKGRLGYSLTPGKDAIRLGQLPSLQFAPATIAACSANNAENINAVLKVYFFGVFGPNGPLPLHLTEYARNRIHTAKDDTFAEFMDIFHHRLLSLFYRAWADKEPTVQFDRTENDRFRFFIGSFAGLAERSQQQRDEISDFTKLSFAAHLGSQTRHANGLITMLNAYFQIPIKIQEFIGEWLEIPLDSLCYLNSDKNTGQLGLTATIGTQSWQCMHKFRIVAGPLNLNQFESFLPDGKKITALCSLVKNYMGFEFAWDINLVLKKEAVPTIQLGKYGQLGWTSWLFSQRRHKDACDLFIDMEKYV